MNQLSPEAKLLYDYFSGLAAIPHGSGNTKGISDHCVSFAKSLGLAVIQDVHNNVIIKKPATPGYEDHPTVILQGHLDMVCEKDPDVDFDFTTDSLKLRLEGDFLSAEGTTLGGDNGIAIAMIMAILADNSIPHPAIEALFTTDEETGMECMKYYAKHCDMPRSGFSPDANFPVINTEKGLLHLDLSGEFTS
ncbi:MAG: M20/M25/M40 family metallo-hydrolase, partial [Clostridia bacterium]|nr:M20/M25/M40 family metallo-hydrolase [Clostridia bacterium]